METARDYAGALIRPLTFMGLQTKKVLLTPLIHPARPFRVSNHDRSSRRGVMASSLQELISKTLDVLVITTGLVTLVLEEDGTVVDTEEFFQTLRDNTHFMILEKGQKWTPGSRSLLRFVSYAAQVTGQFLVYAGSYMLRVLGDTEEQPSPKPSTKGWFM